MRHKYKLFLLSILTLGLIVPLIGSATNNIKVSADSITMLQPNGSGTEDDPFIIKSNEEICYIAYQCNEGNKSFEGSYFELGNDIVYKPSILQEACISNGLKVSAFKGNFDGKGHCVDIDYSSILFTDSRDIPQYFGGLFGHVSGSTIKNLTVKGNITTVGIYAGGLIGYSDGITPGELISYSDDYTIITNCLSLVNISPKMYRDPSGTTTYISPFVGCHIGYELDIFDSVSCAIVNATNAIDVGGFVGHFDTVRSGCVKLTNCLNASDLTSETYCGGFVGSGRYLATQPEQERHIYLEFYNVVSAGVCVSINNPSYSANSDIGYYETLSSNIYLNPLNVYLCSDFAPGRTHFAYAESSNIHLLNKSQLQSTAIEPLNTYVGEHSDLRFEWKPSTTIGAGLNIVSYVGEGTSANPYLITNNCDLIKFAYDTNILSNTFTGKYIKFTNDIDYSGGAKSYTNEISSYYSKAPFAGNIDGCGHTIKTKTGFIIYSGSMAVRNLTIDSNRTGVGNNAGGFTDVSTGRVIFSNCVSKGIIEATNRTSIAGFVGIANSGGNVLTFDNCTNLCEITGIEMISNFIGSIGSGSMYTSQTAWAYFYNCASLGKLIIAGKSSWWGYSCGAFIGYKTNDVKGVKFENCLSDFENTSINVYIEAPFGDLHNISQEGVVVTSYDLCVFNCFGRAQYKYHTGLYNGTPTVFTTKDSNGTAISHDSLTNNSAVADALNAYIDNNPGKSTYWQKWVSDSTGTHIDYSGVWNVDVKSNNPELATISVDKTSALLGEKVTVTVHRTGGHGVSLDYNHDLYPNGFVKESETDDTTVWSFIQAGGNTRITAYFEGDEFEVTLNHPGGIGGTDKVTAIYGSSLPDISTPVKEGYTFLGYFDSINDGTQYYDSDGKSTKNWDKREKSTLYAHWEFIGVDTRMKLAYNYVNTPDASNNTFRLMMAIDYDALKVIADNNNASSYGIYIEKEGSYVAKFDIKNEKAYIGEVETEYNVYSESIKIDEVNKTYKYILIDLGDLITDKTNLNKEYTVCSYVVVNDIFTVSEKNSTYSFASLLNYYLSLEQYKDNASLKQCKADLGL